MDKAPDGVMGKTGTVWFRPFCSDKDDNVMPRPKSSEQRKSFKPRVVKRNGDVYIVYPNIAFRPYVQENVDKSEDETPLSLRKKPKLDE